MPNVHWVRRLAGWAGVALAAGMAALWAFWGAIENFHEGWFDRSLWRNLALMVAQYLSPMLLLMLPGLAALKWPRWSLAIFLIPAVAAAMFFGRHWVPMMMISVPLAALGLLLQFGVPEPRRWAFRVMVGLPLATALVSGAVPGWRAINRLDDGNYGERRIAGNGIELNWAPAGPGWPDRGSTWWDARRNCQYLMADGRSLAATPQNHWRLPTIDEAVRSQVHRGRNAGGAWDGREARYTTWPDKDSPLWNAHSPVIYWWTDTEAQGDRAYRIAYNGMVRAFQKRGWGNYWAYRCVCQAR
jgi:hypothetical protein